MKGSPQDGGVGGNRKAIIVPLTMGKASMGSYSKYPPESTFSFYATLLDDFEAILSKHSLTLPFP